MPLSRLIFKHACLGAAREQAWGPGEGCWRHEPHEDVRMCDLSPWPLGLCLPCGGRGERTGPHPPEQGQDQSSAFAPLPLAASRTGTCPAECGRSWNRADSSHCAEVTPRARRSAEHVLYVPMAAAPHGPRFTAEGTKADGLKQLAQGSRAKRRQRPTGLDACVHGPRALPRWPPCAHPGLREECALPVCGARWLWAEEEESLHTRRGRQ